MYKTLITLLLVAITSAEPNVTGFTVAGLPSGSFQSGRGLKYGGRIHLIQYGDGSIAPYKWNLALDGSNTTENQLETTLFFDMPEAAGPRSRFDFLIQFSRLLQDDFYGLGNSSEYHPEYSDPDHADFKNEFYNNHKIRWLAVISNFQFPLLEKYKGLWGAGVYYRTVTPYSRPNKLLEDNPNGMAGGWSNYLRLGLLLDTRDEETVPTKGTWFDLLLEGATSYLNSDYDYLRLTVTDRRYTQVAPHLVFARRIFFEIMPGHPPFYEMSVMGNSFRRQEGLGGAYSLRGVPRYLFVGPHKFVSNLELRWQVLQKTILRQPLTFYIHLFGDGGRVWTGRNLPLEDFHFSHGAGLHIKWKKDFVGALDIGRSHFQGMAIYATFGNLF